jgi:general L-amino acid transport system substrate-binding protein
VGNYAQIFESNIGSASPIKLPRGMNALWKNGGMIYSPPAR